MIILSLILLFSSVCVPVYASSTPTYYARIMQENTLLYKDAIEIDEPNNIWFCLPRTYFVKLTDSANSNFFQAEYMGIAGYVKKEQVQTILGTPQTPYLTNISFRVFAEMSRDLRSFPNTQGGTNEQVTYLPLYTKNLTYFGTIEGEALIEGRTKTWYYCKYTADKDYFGYVYSDFCDQLSTMPLNMEEVEYTTAPTFNEETPTLTALPVENKTTGIIVAILSIPALVFVYLLIKGNNVSKNNVKTKEIIDYSAPHD